MDKSLVIGGVVTTLVVFSAHKILQRIRLQKTRQQMFNIISEMDALEKLTKEDPLSVTSTLNS